MKNANNNNRLSYNPTGLLYQVLDFVSAVKTLSACDKLLYTQLTKHAFGQKFTFIGQEKLAELCSCSIRTIQRSLNKLSTLGFIQIVKEGSFTKYFFEIPEEFKLLASQVRLVQGDKMSSAPQENADSGSFFSTEDDNVSKSHDILSYRYKSLGLNTNTTPLPPTDNSEPQTASGSSPSSQDSSLLEQFSRLFEAYPPRGNREKAFKVFCRLHSVLPEIDKLIQCVEYEKVHNKKWHRGYAFFLEKWLNQGLYKETMPFIKRTAKQQAHGIEAQSIVAQALSSDLLQKEKAQSVPNPIGKLHVIPAFNEQEFNSCADLWPETAMRKSVNKYYWHKLLSEGIAPVFAEAQKVKSKFNSFFEWLQSFKQQQLVGA